MSSLSEQWREIPFSNRGVGPPKLLFKFITNSKGYELYVTDFIHCWKDFGDRQAITEEAARECCSINPSDDASQFEVLLSKLRDGLAGRNGGKCKIGTGCRDTSDSESLGGFMLSVKTPLPRPLKPLCWTFHLYQADPILLARELLLPALASELKYRTQIEELRRKIGEKDHVITRLMDKVEQSSVDLSLVFPGYSTGRKGLDAKHAVKVVPGISRFDAAVWQKGHENEMVVTTQSLAEAIRKPGFDKLSFNGPRDPRYGPAAWEPFGTAGKWNENWIDAWGEEATFTDEESVNPTPHVAHPIPNLSFDESTGAFEDVLPANDTHKDIATSLPAPRSSPATSQRTHSTSSNDSIPAYRKLKPSKLGSRRSRSPPNRNSSNSNLDKSAASSAAISTSTSDSDTDVTTPQRKRTLKKSSKLGKLGGRKKLSQSLASRTSPSPPEVSTKSSTPPRKLGALGGKKEHTPRSSSPNPSRLQAGTSTSQHTPSRKLGVLGGRHKSATPKKTETSSRSTSQHKDQVEDLEATDSPSPSPSSSPSTAYPSHSTTTMKGNAAQKASTEPQEEPLTAEEIADRKREELKRTLDAGGGKKKRRKF